MSMKSAGSKIQRALLAVGLIVFNAIPGLAQEPAQIPTQKLQVPTDTVVLTVSGQIGLTNVGKTARFDMAMLRALPAREFETSTIWTEGVQRFRGVPLNEFVGFLKMQGTIMVASAINEYSIEFPIAEAIEDGPLLAYEMNGKEMSRRGKGPLWIVYPYDANSDFRTETTYIRSIWQLDRIDVE